MAKIKIEKYKLDDFYTVAEVKRLKGFCKTYRETTKGEGNHEAGLIQRATAFCLYGDPDRYIFGFEIIGEIEGEPQKNGRMPWDYYGDYENGGFDMLLTAWVKYHEYNPDGETKEYIVKVFCFRASAEQEDFDSKQTAFILDRFAKF